MERRRRWRRRSPRREDSGLHFGDPGPQSDGRRPSGKRFKCMSRSAASVYFVYLRIVWYGCQKYECHRTEPDKQLFEIRSKYEIKLACAAKIWCIYYPRPLPTDEKLQAIHLNSDNIIDFLLMYYPVALILNSIIEFNDRK